MANEETLEGEVVAAKPTREVVRALNTLIKDEWLADSGLLGQSAWQDLRAAQEAAIEELPPERPA